MSEPATIPEKFAHFAAILDGAASIHAQRRQKHLGPHLTTIIHNACDSKLTKLQAKQTALAELLKNWRDLKARQDRENENRGHIFNPIALIPIGETTHSRLIGELLNPKGSHGQGRRLLDTFLEMQDVPDPMAGEWMISIEEGKVDMCLRRSTPASVIIIENKSNFAVDQPNQLYRYWYQNIFRRHPKLDYSKEEVRRSFQIIYLAPTAEKQPDFQSLDCPPYLAVLGLPESLAKVGVTVRVCSFQHHIAGWLSRCEELIPPDNHRLRAYLQFYKELWI